MLRKFWKAGLVSLALFGAMGGANAFTRLPDVAIERAMNGQLITVRFSHTNARLIELKVNGISVGTRSVNGASEASTEFKLDPATFEDGKNKVEAFIYDDSGNLIAVESTKMEVDLNFESPVMISTPKNGSTVQGLVEMKLDMKRNFGKVIASFMVDGEWKAIRNYSPYTYVLDTETLTNGWHEIQALVVDENNVTWKSRKHRIFVNNPGGRTERATPVAPKVTTAVAPKVAPVAATLAGNSYAATVTKSGQTKFMGVSTPAATITSARMLTPTGKRTLVAPKTVKATPAKATPAKVTPAKATPAKVTPAKATPAKVTPAKATPAKAIPSKTIPAEAIPAKVTTVKPVAPKKLPPVSIVAPKTTSTKVVAPKATPVKATPVTTVNSASSMARVQSGLRLNFNGNLKIALEGKIVNFDVQPRVQDGVALSPFRHLYEAQGGKVKWNNSTKSLNAKGGGNAIVLSIGSRYATVGNRKLSLEMMPFIEKGRTIVPLSFVSDALNVNVDVDSKTGHVLITKKK
jgi:hypothetical protein